MPNLEEDTSALITSNHSGGIPEWITNEYLENLLRSTLKDGSIQVGDFDISPGSNVGDNYACQIFRIKVNYTRNNQKESKSIIAKVIPKTDLADAIGTELDIFSVEQKMLSETLPLLYEEYRTKIDSDRFFPECYKIDIENKMIFIEDLKPQGYVLADKKLGLDLDHVTLVVKALAKMHASGYLLLKKNPDYYKKYLTNFYKKDEESFLAKMMIGTNNALLKSIHLWPISEEDKETFRKLNIHHLTVDSYERKESSFNVLIHGDCWVNNMMFKYENGKVVSVKLFDYQISNYNSIGCDLNYFLFTSAQENVKLNHLEDVLKTYYNTFVSITGDIDGFSFDTVRNEFIDRLGYGFSVGMLFSPAMLADIPFDIDKCFEGKESKNNLEIYRNKQYLSTAPKLLPIFKKYGVFK